MDGPFGRLIRITGEVVVARHPGWESRRGVVVQDQGLAGELGEVDDHIGALGRSDEQRVLIPVAHVEASRVGDPGMTCWPSMTAGLGRKPPSVPIWIQSGPAGLRFRSGVGKTPAGSSWAAATSLAFNATSVPPIT